MNKIHPCTDPNGIQWVPLREVRHLEAEVERLRAVIRDIRAARFRQLHDSEADQYDAILKACEAALAAGGKP